MHVHVHNGAAIQRVAVNTASSGDTALVAAQPGKKIRVIGLDVHSAGTVTIALKDGSSVYEGGVRSLILGSQCVIKHPYMGQPAYEGTVNTALNIALGGAVQVTGSLWYTVGDS